MLGGGSSTSSLSPQNRSQRNLYSQGQVSSGGASGQNPSTSSSSGYVPQSPGPLGSAGNMLLSPSSAGASSSQPQNLSLTSSSGYVPQSPGPLGSAGNMLLPPSTADSSPSNPQNFSPSSSVGYDAQSPAFLGSAGKMLLSPSATSSFGSSARYPSAPSSYSPGAQNPSFSSSARYVSQSPPAGGSAGNILLTPSPSPPRGRYFAAATSARTMRPRPPASGDELLLEEVPQYPRPRGSSAFRNSGSNNSNGGAFLETSQGARPRRPPTTNYFYPGMVNSTRNPTFSPGRPVSDKLQDEFDSRLTRRYKVNFSPGEYESLRNSWQPQNMFFERSKNTEHYFQFPQLQNPNDQGQMGQGHRGHGQMGQGQMGQGQMDQGQMGQGQMGQGQMGQGQMDQGQMGQGQMGQGQMGQGQMGQGQMGQGQMGHQGQMGQGQMGQGQMSQGQMDQGQMGQGQMRQGQMGQGQMGQGQMGQGHMSQRQKRQGESGDEGSFGFNFGENADNQNFAAPRKNSDSGYGGSVPLGGTGNYGIPGSYGASSSNINVSSGSPAANAESLYVVVPTPGGSRSLDRPIPFYDANQNPNNARTASSYVNVPTPSASNVASGESVSLQAPRFGSQNPSPASSYVMVPTPAEARRKEEYNYKTHFVPEEYDYLRNCLPEENMFFARPKHDGGYFKFPELQNPKLDIHKWRQDQYLKAMARRVQYQDEETHGMSFGESAENQNLAAPPRMPSWRTNNTSPTITLTDTETGRQSLVEDVPWRRRSIPGSGIAQADMMTYTGYRPRSMSNGARYLGNYPGNAFPQQQTYGRR